MVLPRFDLRQFLAAIEKHRITAVYVAPPIVLALAKHPLVADYDLSSLRYLVSAAAPWTPSWRRPAPGGSACRRSCRRTA